jgi:SEC-C motif-containing protein
MNTDKCICCSGKAFEHCCQPLLLGKRVAKTPVQLMRSRYSAFALGGYGDYLLKTWGVAGAIGLKAAELSVRNIDWLSLEIVSNSQKGNAGFVEFKATFLDSNKEPAIHHEHSRFERDAGQWRYISGEILG